MGWYGFVCVSMGWGGMIWVCVCWYGLGWDDMGLCVLVWVGVG